MIANLNRFFPLQLSTEWKRILIAAFLSFGLGIPSASANCFKDFSKDFSQSRERPVLPASIAPQISLRDPNDARPDVSTNGIVGLWNVTFSSDGQTVDVAFDAWHSDGTEVLNDYTNPIEGNVCLGAWVQTGPRTFKLKHPSWSFDDTGTLQGIVIIRESVTVSPDGNSFHGSYAYDIYDTTGAFLQEYTGNVSGIRIRVD